MPYSFRKALEERKTHSAALRQAEEWRDIKHAWQMATRVVFGKKHNIFRTLRIVRFSNGTLEVACGHAAECASARLQERELLSALNRILGETLTVHSLRFHLEG
ncbi:MAG: hypothetical protein A2806_01205 [Candidatus Terrybacteria bacterium RIFCSPHIGHO2_01_FULL_48_17]|uniref:DUF721 domain-containing protein n=1 Tax=Candidatus Terrybacteria bacterium RIFCSPHIGHO2_01_FULL_48_17 TaxID=1802362 RepID=A0A1G2PK46_9BACT|nr:MAG: hypothetical protein A2806_01205 [Candidatus Terrybacteria bacterium RIFCSPHIGHO2_01_FULL_48_17]OHA53414.1 MAG: hypothetical protein A3A30_02745 [Candidatus Terrybacteria bacterium RIFCSPLOWO2_01_FULL_48_14]